MADKQQWCLTVGGSSGAPGSGLAAVEGSAGGWEQGQGLLEFLVAPVQLLHLGLVLRPGMG